MIRVNIRRDQVEDIGLNLIEAKGQLLNIGYARVLPTAKSECDCLPLVMTMATDQAARAAQQQGSRRPRPSPRSGGHGMKFRTVCGA